MNKTTRITESQLVDLVRRAISEQSTENTISYYQKLVEAKMETVADLEKEIERLQKNIKEIKGKGKKTETKEGFWDNLFGKADVDRATRDSMRSTGVSARGRKDSNYGESPKPEDEYVVFKGEKFGTDQIEYASPYDLGEIPRVENGKLIVSNPAWES